MARTARSRSPSPARRSIRGTRSPPAAAARAVRSSAKAVHATQTTTATRRSVTVHTASNGSVEAKSTAATAALTSNIPLSRTLVPSNVEFSDDGTMSFFWQRHTAIALTIVVAGLIYTALYIHDDNELTNRRRGVLGMVVIFLTIAAVQLADGPFFRPHPIVWRLVMGMTILYQLLLVYILMQNPTDGRQLLKHWDPTLGVPLSNESYGEDCEIYIPDHPSGNPFHNFAKKWDIFVFGHTFGYVCKALIVRDFYMLQVMSILFEFLEYSLSFHLPNFFECWWDHWVLDMICNTSGILIGMALCRWLSVQSYNWQGLKNIPTLRFVCVIEAGRVVKQFSPYYWTQFEWNMMGSIRRWFISGFLVFILLSAEVLAFYLKQVLWVPANHHLNLVRLAFLTPAAAVGTREIYQYLIDPNAREFGKQLWILCSILITEALISYKYGQFPDSSMPWEWRLVWAGLAVLYVSVTFYWFVLPIIKNKTA